MTRTFGTAILLFAFAGIAALQSDEPARLLRQLGDADFAVRERAYQKLRELGPAARSALAIGVRDGDEEIRSRCRELLARITDAEIDERLQAFLDGKEDLPGWPRYRSVVRAAERRKFAELYRAAKPLFESAEKDIKQARKLLLAKNGELEETFFNSPKQVDLAELLAVLLLAGDPRMELEPADAGKIFSVVDTLSLWKSLREKLQTDAAARTLLVDFLDKSPETSLRGDALALIMRLELREGLPLARRTLADRNAPPSTRAAALMAIGKVGSTEDIPPACLEDTSVIGQQRLRTTVLSAQVRDVALAMLIHLHGADPEEYGFPYLQAIPGPLFSYPPTCFGFANSTERGAAIQRWKKVSRR